MMANASPKPMRIQPTTVRSHNNSTGVVVLEGVRKGGGPINKKPANWNTSHMK